MTPNPAAATASWSDRGFGAVASRASSSESGRARRRSATRTRVFATIVSRTDIGPLTATPARPSRRRERHRHLDDGTLAQHLEHLEGLLFALEVRGWELRVFELAAEALEGGFADDHLASARDTAEAGARVR